MNKTSDYEPAGTGREQAARELFPLGMSPEEYAAREGHRWMMFGFATYSYSDPVLHNWIHRLDAILAESPDVPDIETLRQKHLSVAERDQIKRETERQAEDF